MLLNKLKSWWFGEKEKTEYPYKYARVVYTKEAMSEGNFDTFQKKLQVLKNNEITENYDYSEADVEAIKRRKLPFVDMTKMSLPDFDFIQTESFGEVKGEL